VDEVRCTTWGRTHPISESELSFKLPDIVFGLSEEDRNSRCRIGPDIVSLDDERFFIRGLLPLAVPGRERTYNVGVWGEVSAETFERIYELWNASEQHQEPRMPGTLANKLPFHPDTLGLAVSVQLTGPKSRPQFSVQAAEHSLYVEQLQGIDEHRAIEYSDPAARKAAVEQALAGDARNARA
jgi:hypothetical protein